MVVNVLANISGSVLTCTFHMIYKLQLDYIMWWILDECVSMIVICVDMEWFYE